MRNVNAAYLSSLNRLFFDVLPKVDRELDSWQERLNRGPLGPQEKTLRNLAESSIKFKKFHCQGGSVYSLLVHKEHSESLIKAIVAIQTISDYLDNLCDRRGIADEKAFRQIHNAFLDALDLGEKRGDYYKYYPDKEDQGFLESLVDTSRENLAAFNNYSMVQDKIMEFGQYYCDLQVYKHLALDIREEKLIASLKNLQERYPKLTWYELAASTGSTLGIFTLMAAATKDSLTEVEVESLSEAYFPWIAGLHILLDYYIDQEEDIKEGDLNFVAYYPDEKTRKERLILFLEEALKRAAILPDARFHGMVVRGLLALYLTDTKLKKQGLEREAKSFIKKGGFRTLPLYGFCKTLRAVGKI